MATKVKWQHGGIGIQSGDILSESERITSRSLEKLWEMVSDAVEVGDSLRQASLKTIKPWSGTCESW